LRLLLIVGEGRVRQHGLTLLAVGGRELFQLALLLGRESKFCRDAIFSLGAAGGKRLLLLWGEGGLHLLAGAGAQGLQLGPLLLRGERLIIADDGGLITRVGAQLS